MDGSSPLFFDDGNENQLTIFFSCGTSLFKHVLLYGFFEGNLDSANKFKNIPS